MIRAVLLSAALLAGGPAFADPVRFLDGAGREIALPEPAHRVVVLPITAASTFIAIGQSTERLISIHPRAQQTLGEGLLGRIFPGIAKLPAPVEAQGSDMSAPNVEAIAALHPDLVFQSDQQSSGEGALDRVGLTTALIRYGSEEAVREALRIMAAAVGKPERAERMIAWRDEVTAEIARKLDGVAERPRVLYITDADGGYSASGSGRFNDYSILLSGGENAAADMPGAQVVTAEQVLLWNPDIILLPSFSDRLSPQDVFGDPLLASTNAGRTRRVYRSPMGGYRWEAPSQENPLFWMWLSNTLHPDLPRFDLRREMTEAYKWIYGYEVTAQDQDQILQLEVNRDSEGYLDAVGAP